MDPTPIQTASGLAARRLRRGSSAGALRCRPAPLEAALPTLSIERRLPDSQLRRSGSDATCGAPDEAAYTRPWSREAVLRLGASAPATLTKKLDAAAPCRSAFRRQGGRHARRSSSGCLRLIGTARTAGYPAPSTPLPQLGLCRERNNCSMMTPMSRAATPKGTRAATPSVAFRRSISEHFVEPYAEIYGMHPSLFEFNRRGEMQLTDEGIAQEIAQELTVSLLKIA